MHVQLALRPFSVPILNEFLQSSKSPCIILIRCVRRKNTENNNKKQQKTTPRKTHSVNIEETCDVYASISSQLKVCSELPVPVTSLWHLHSFSKDLDSLPCQADNLEIDQRSRGWHLTGMLPNLKLEVLRHHSTTSSRNIMATQLPFVSLWLWASKTQN